MMHDILLKSLVLEVLKVSEKAASLARIVRSEESLFELLVQEKKGDQSNKRFVQDFKTLADVLVQETVRHDLGKKFDHLVEHINGEESNKFTNTLGESVVVTVQDSEAATAELLCSVLDGNSEAARLLSRVVHQDVELHIDDQSEIDSLGSVTLSQESVGIWIDPIDSTAEYITAIEGSVSPTGIHSSGLQCVTVLIGAYDLTTGCPLFGCANQPFVHFNPQSNKWSGRRVWGVFYNGLSVRSASCPLPDASPDLASSHSVVVSTSESDHVLQRLSGKFVVEHAAGAGYKILCTVDQLVASYVLSRSNTFKWDTCAPHAILLAKGGGIVDLQQAVDAAGRGWLTDKVAADCQLRYNQANDGYSAEAVERWSNSGGVIAYCNVDVLAEILAALAISHN